MLPHQPDASLTQPTPQPAAAPAEDKSSRILLIVILSLLAAVPLAMSTAVYNTTVLPKYVLLLLGSALSLFLLTIVFIFDSGNVKRLLLLRSKLVLAVSLYLLTAGLSTCFGVAPVASLFGSLESRMGLISYFCFFICFAGIIAGIGTSERRLTWAVWTMAAAGVFAAAYALLQFVGRDPFLPASAYTFRSPAGALLRVPATLGHPDYLGNFLLYTIPMGVALALTLRGRERRLAFAAAALATAPLIFSGTRGAWAGILGGAGIAAVLGGLELRQRRAAGGQFNRRHLVGAGTAAAILAISIGIILASPRGASVARRLRASASDATGAGRTLLWRDAVKMIPAYALRGCGPEGFSKAFLAYKSPQLARSAPQINSESSHDTYLDALIEFGLLGGVLHLAMIVIAGQLLWRLSRRPGGENTTKIALGLLTALVAVSIHNIFIYNQISTGLYFFALLAISVATANVAAVNAVNRRQSNAPIESREADGGDAPFSAPPPRSSATLRWGSCAAAALLVVLAAWYAFGAARADFAIKRAFDAAARGDYPGLVRSGQVAVAQPDPARAYDYLFARALTNFADAASRGLSASQDGDLRKLRAQAMQLAEAHAQAALRHSLTPEANCVLLAYLALQMGESERLRDFAAQALAWDPNLFSAHWLMAESWLAGGNRAEAAAEAERAIFLRPNSIEARSAMVRARGESLVGDRNVEGLLELARVAESRSKLGKAARLVRRAIREADAPCPICHRALALIYEKQGRYQDAMDEWGTLMNQSLDLATSERVPLRMKALKDKAEAHSATSP